jgi:hypothetical protein
MHTDHAGMCKTMTKAREAVYWPAMNQDITRVVENCYAFIVTSRKNRSEPMIPGKLTDYPFQISEEYGFIPRVESSIRCFKRDYSISLH